MSTKKLALLLVPLVIIAGLLLALQGPKHESGSVSSSVRNPAAEQAVEQFGQKMKQVSLLAPAADVRAAMEANYTPYVVPELLAAWQADPQHAPGRRTSSPWPARIQIGMSEGGGSAYVVHGTVVEVVNGQGGAEEIVGTYPVKVRVQERDGAWRITAFESGAYSDIPHQMTITGVYTCLPHRDAKGPQTTECALGIKQDGTGKHYSINTSLMSSTMWREIPTGSRIRVQGVVTPIEMLSSDHWQKYDIVGIISATKLQKI